MNKTAALLVAAMLVACRTPEEDTNCQPMTLQWDVQPSAAEREVPPHGGLRAFVDGHGNIIHVVANDEGTLIIIDCDHEEQ